MPKIIATKNDWIQLGYELFSKSGISGIVIERMAHKLKVNKSSFYWHFKTKKEFVSNLIDYWIATETEGVISQVELAQSPNEKLKLFFKIAFKNDPYLEFIFWLKRYGKNNARVQTIIEEVDKRRLLFTSQLFQEIGYSKKEAPIKAAIFYKYLIGYHEMIRHKKQNKNYLIEVEKDLKHFLNF